MEKFTWTGGMLVLAAMAVGMLEARPNQFEPRRTGPFTAHEKEILKHVEGKVCQRQLPNDILISKPDFVVLVPEQSIFREKIDLAKPSDTYNDHFQVFYDERRKLMYAFWTQACTEAGPDQHISFAKSADKGRTWTKPVILAGGEYKARPRLAASWQQPMLSRSGRLYCLWNQQVTSIGPHMGNMFGIYSDDAGETWSPVKQVKFGFKTDMDPKDPAEPPCWCNWQRPLRLGENGKYFVGCSRDGQASYDPHRCTRIDFWQFENIDDDPKVEDIRITCLNPDRTALGVEDIDEPDLKLFHVGDKTRWQTVAEAAPVKLPDGRLFVLCRSSTGYPLWAVSSDGGRTWSKLKVLRDRRGKPFLHPCSPGPLYDWKGCEAGSGTYFALIHNTFDFNGENSYQTRGPLYLLAGRYVPNAAQPIQFDDPQLFTPREDANSFYASYTVVDGEGVLWYNDQKYYLLGRKIGQEWFRR